MKKHLLLPLLVVFALSILTSAYPRNTTGGLTYNQKQSLAEYAGKYQLNQPGGPAPLLAVSVADSSLVFTETWDHNKKMTVKHLSGDKFIVEGLDWSVQFIRDKNKNITEVVVMGKDHWVKVKN
jgi:hypothetical protein